MTADFNKNEFGQNQKTPKHQNGVLVGEFCRLQYEFLNKDYYNQKSKDLGSCIKDDFEKSVQKFDKAKERMKQQMIISDNSKDNSVLYTAMTQFKKNHE